MGTLVSVGQWYRKPLNTEFLFWPNVHGDNLMCNRSHMVGGSAEAGGSRGQDTQGQPELWPGIVSDGWARGRESLDH